MWLQSLQIMGLFLGCVFVPLPGVAERRGFASFRLSTVTDGCHAVFHTWLARMMVDSLNPGELGSYDLA